MGFRPGPAQLLEPERFGLARRRRFETARPLLRKPPPGHVLLRADGFGKQALARDRRAVGGGRKPVQVSGRHRLGVHPGHEQLVSRDDLRVYSGWLEDAMGQVDALSGAAA